MNISYGATPSINSEVTRIKSPVPSGTPTISWSPSKWYVGQLLEKLFNSNSKIYWEHIDYQWFLSWIGLDSSMPNFALPKWNSITQKFEYSHTYSRNGNIWIGTNAPTQKLHVVGNTYTKGTLLFHSSDTVKRWNLRSVKSDEPANFNEEMVLWFIATTSDGGDLDRSSILIAPYDGAGWGRWRIQIDARRIELKSAMNDAALIVEDSGNIGLGIRNPNYKLDVLGDINFTWNLYKNGTLFKGGKFQDGTPNKNDAVFATSNVPGRYVGIGIDTPNHRLHVNGNVASNHIYAQNNTYAKYISGGDAHDTWGNILMYGGNYGTTSRRSDIFFRSNGTSRMGIDGDTGNVGIGNGTQSSPTKLFIESIDGGYTLANAHHGFPGSSIIRPAGNTLSNYAATINSYTSDGGGLMIFVGDDNNDESWFTLWNIPNKQEVFNIKATSGDTYVWWNLGIGSPNTQAKLDVRWKTLIHHDSTNYDIWIQWGLTTQGRDERNLALLGIKSTDELRINYAGEYKWWVRIQGARVIMDGNVWIGTTNPSQKLDVNGHIRTPNQVRANQYCDKNGGNCLTSSTISDGLWSKNGNGYYKNSKIMFGTTTPFSSVGSATSTWWKRLHVSWWVAIGDGWIAVSGYSSFWSSVWFDADIYSSGWLPANGGNNSWIWWIKLRSGNGRGTFGHMFNYASSDGGRWAGSNISQSIVFSNANDARLDNSMFFNTNHGNLWIGASAPWNIRLNVNGNARAASWLTSSDFRLKKDIANLNNSEKLLELQAVTYNWKDESLNSDTKKIGFIAQNVEKYFPEVVSVDDNGFKSVAYSELIPVLVDVIQSQELRIKQLEWALK